MDNWAEKVKEMSFVSRAGDIVRINAPINSMGAMFNGADGVIDKFDGGWVHVRINQDGLLARFRPDELLTL